MDSFFLRDWYYLVKHCLLVLVTSSEMIQITRHNSMISEVIGTFIITTRVQGFTN